MCLSDDQLFEKDRQSKLAAPLRHFCRGHFDAGAAIGWVHLVAEVDPAAGPSDARAGRSAAAAGGSSGQRPGRAAARKMIRSGSSFGAAGARRNI